MERGGELQASFPADGPCRPTERSFRGDMDRIGRKASEDFGYPFSSYQRESDVRIGGAGNGGKICRGDHQYVMAPGRQGRRRPAQGGDDTVDLRMPGIGHDTNFHSCRWGTGSGRGCSFSHSIMPDFGAEMQIGDENRSEMIRCRGMLRSFYISEQGYRAYITIV